MPTYDVDVAGLTYEVDAPDENTAWRWANYEHRKRAAAEAAKPQPEGGFFPAVRQGFEGLKGSAAALAGRVGLMDEAEAQAAYEAAQKRQQEIFKPTEEGWTEAPFTKFKETLGGSLAYMVAPLAVAGAAATLPVTGTAATVATLGAAGLTSAAQFTATNLSRQMEEGKKLTDTDLGNAALAAVPMALLDTLSLRLLPGVGRILGDAGIKVTKETAKEVSEQILKKAAIDYTAATGKAMGVEGLTEAAQQGLERLQAGLSLTDASARDEYLESLIGGAVLGGTFGAAGRAYERGRAGREVRAVEEGQAREAREATRAAEEAEKKTPEYLEGKYNAYQDLLAQKNALRAQIKQDTKEAPLSQDDKDANAVVNKQLAALKKPLEDARQAFLAAGGPQAMAKLRAGRLELTPPPGRVTEPPAAVEEEEAPEIAGPRAAQEVRGLTDLLEQQRVAVRDAATDEEAIAAAEQAQRTEQALQKARDTLAKYPGAPDPAKLQKEVTALEKKFADARAAGEQADVIKFGRELLEKRQQLRAYAPDTGLFAPEFDEERVRQELGVAMGAGREAAAQERGARVAEEGAQARRLRELQAEIEALQRIGATGEPIGEAVREGREAQRLEREYAGLRRGEQLGLFPEGRERVVRTAEGTRISGRQQMLREEIAELEKQRDAKEKSQEQALAGTFARDPAQAADINRRIAAKRLELKELDFDTVDTQRTIVPGETPEVSIAPQATLAERVDTLAQQVLASPQTEPETKALVEQVVDNLPAFRRNLPLLERFLYRARTGVARPEDIEDAGEVRRILDEAAAGQLSETERLPSGETRRAVQLDIPLPEPKAVAFESFGKFNDYLASEGLQAYRAQSGLMFPTIANLQRRFAPIQQRISELEKQLLDIDAKRKALAKADETERADASNLLREAEKKLQRTVADLDTLAQTTYVGKKLEPVNIADLQRQAKKRVTDALAHSEALNKQLEENLKRIASAEAATKEVGVDAQGRPTENTSQEVRRVRLGQLPGYQALRAAQLELQEKGLALVEADKKVEQVVKEGIGQSWEEGSPTLNAYLSAKKAKEEARRAAQQAHYKLIQANRNIPGVETLNQNFAKFIEQKSALDNELAKAAKAQSALRMGLRNASNRLNDAYVRMENIPDMRFGENLQRLRSDLLAAESIQTETEQRSAARQAEREQLGKEGAALARPLRERREVISDVMRKAQERAKARQGVPPGETQADREARDADKRREEQARLERMESSEGVVRTLIQFERFSERSLADETYTKLVERSYDDTLSSEKRIAAAEKADAYLAQRAANLAAEEEKNKGNAQKHASDLESAERKLAELTKKKEGIKLSRAETRALKTAEERDARLKEKQQKIDAAIENQKRLVEKHQRLRSASLMYPEVKRVDPAELKAYRERLNEEVLRGREAGERLGARAIGPMTRPEVMPPKTMRTGSEESREGLTTTPSRNKITEARGEKQRDIPLRKKEMAEANLAAAQLELDNAKTPFDKKRAEIKVELAEIQREIAYKGLTASREAAVSAELRRFERAAKTEFESAVAAPLSKKEEKQVEKALRGKSTKKTREKELDLLYATDEDFTPEVLGGSREELFYSRGATPNPSTTADVRGELKSHFPDLGRVQIYDSVDALVKANPQYEGRVPSDARGFVDTAGEKAFLIAGNINQGQALSVLLHEVGSHIGLKKLLGDKQYNTFVNAVKSWEKRDDASPESRVARAARNRVEAAETPAGQVNDELLAYAIEEAVNAGVTPNTKSPVGQWLGRIIQRIETALRSFFKMEPKGISLRDIVNAAYGAAKVEMEPVAAAPQMSRRQFLRGAGAALGALKLPPLSKDMQVSALKAAFEGSLKASDVWFAAAKAAVGKNKALLMFLDDAHYDANDMALDSFVKSRDLSSFLYHVAYDDDAEGYDYYLNDLLSGKDGVKIVADLQQALQAQRAAVVDAVQKTAKEKKLPEVGELFFSEISRIDTYEEAKKNDARLLKQVEQFLLTGTPVPAPTTLYRGGTAVGQAYTHATPWAAVAAKAGKLLGYDPKKPELVYEYKVAKNQKYYRGGALEGDPLETTRIHNAKGMTWDQALNAAKKLFDAEVRALPERYTNAYLANPENKQDAIEGIAGQVTEDFFNAVYETDATNKPGVWTNKKVPEELMQDTPKLRKAAPGELQFSRATYAPEFKGVGETAESILGSRPSVFQRLKANLSGMGFRTNWVDKLVPTEAALKEAVNRGQLEDYKAAQSMYYLRMYDQRSHFTSMAITDGAPVIRELDRKGGGKEYLIESEPGANIKQVVDILARKDVVKAAGSADAASRLFTLYDVAKRAERTGFDKLNLKDPKITEESLREVRAKVDGNAVLKDAFKEARDTYNTYNRNLLEFVRDTGALPKALVDELLRYGDYIPFYRANPKGEVELVLGSEISPVRIANLKDSPHLKELIGGDKPVLNFLESSVQNSSMLLDMALKNLSQKNLAWEMSESGLGKNFSVEYEKGGKTVKRQPPEGALMYKLKGKDWFFVPDEAALNEMGVDAGLLMKGLEGIPTMFPTVMKLLSAPTRLLRRMVVASPPYMARQLMRDSLAAVLTSGANMTPVLSAIKQIGRKGALDRRGIVGGQVFTGLPEDMSTLLKQMQSGKPGWTQALAKLEAISMEVDASNRRVQYESYLQQGLSEMEATYMALESMNFSKRGLSSSAHMAAQLIPFFNAQIQGLDVLYKALTGKMPFEKQLDIKNKLYTRGLLMAAGSIAYALAMQDDEAYQNANPDEKYGNWFVRIPGFEEPFRVPIPFELGYIFKALPEAVVNIALRDEGAKEAKEAFSRILLNTIPGGSSYGLPQAIKPAIEVGLGKSFFTMRDIESAREQAVEPWARFREKTTDAAKWVGEQFNISPIKLEYLIQGYTGSLGMAMLAALNPAFPDVTAEGATKRLSEYPLVGGFFQPNDAGGIINATYERMKDIQQIQNTYKDMLTRQGPEAARAYAEKNAQELAAASLAGRFRQEMGELTKQEREVRAARNLTPERRRELMDRLKQAKIRLATVVRSSLDRTTRQAVPA
jgi:hypothetical protein